MQETIYLPTPGPIPGFPGASHGPGEVILDYDARTVTPVPVSDGQQLETQPTQDASTPSVPG